MKKINGTYAGKDVSEALEKAAEDLDVPVEDLEHQPLTPGREKERVLVRAWIKQRSSLEVEEYLRGILAGLGLDAKIESERTGKSLEIRLDGAEAAELLGPVESHLEHLARMAARKLDPGTRIEFSVGVEAKDRDALVEHYARRAVEVSRRLGLPVGLAPMNSYERRIVHLAVREGEGARSESRGSGSTRRVVVMAGSGPGADADGR